MFKIAKRAVADVEPIIHNLSWRGVKAYRRQAYEGRGDR